MTDTIESLRQQLAECQATNGKLRSDMSLFLDSHEECEDFDGFTAQIVSMDDYHKAQDALVLPNDATALNELIAERTKTQKEYYESVFQDGANRIAELTAEVERLKSGVVCGDCDGSGWLENRVEGRHPCTCMTEAEPYQLLIEQNAELTSWKQQAITVLNEIDLQEIGKVLGVGLGESVGPHILPAIKKLTAELEDWWREIHDEACTNMEDCTSFGGTKQCFRPRPSILKGQSK